MDCFPMDTTTTSHLCIYMSTLITSYYVSYSYDYILSLILSPIIFGWSLYGITTIGHDLLHVPTKQNRRLSFICMDMTLFNSDEWIQIHNKDHHGDLNGENDIMKLKGTNLLTEWYHLLEISKQPTLIHHVYRIPFYIVLFQLRWYQIISIYMTVFFCIAYFTYITHSNPVPSKYAVGTIQHNLDHIWDIFPESWFITLLFGGINAHATHHCFPTCNRSEFIKKSRYLSHKYSNYRVIHTYKQLYTLYSTRFKQSSNNHSDTSDTSTN